jgi:hypothetical protein
MAGPMATETHSPPARCPSCGARITRPELSLCAYCATPLALAATPKGADEAVLQRLARMSEHKDYPEALTWQPTEMDDAPGAARSRRRGLGLILLGALLLALGLVPALARGEPAAALRTWPTWVGLVLGGLAGLQLTRAAALLRRIRAQPLQRRAAIVIDRRSVTTPTGLGASTIYFFSLQFADGSAGEFSFLGRGANYEVPAAGATGLACTRGARLLEFLRLRV